MHKGGGSYYLNGLFVVVAGVVGLSSIIMSFSAIAAPSGTGQPQPAFVSMNALVQGNTSSRLVTIPWKDMPWKTNGTKNLGYAVLGELAQSIAVSSTVAQITGPVEYAYVAKVSDFSDVPMAFSFKHKSVMDAAGQATGWSAANQFTMPTSPDLAGKWLTIYEFVRNNDGVTGAAGLPQGIDDVSAIIFQVPQSFKGAQGGTVNTAVPLTIKAAPFWAGNHNINFPAKTDTVVQYFQITSQSDKPIELRKFKLDVLTGTPYNSTLAIIRVPQGASDKFYGSLLTLVGTGAVSNTSATSTVGVGIIKTEGATNTAAGSNVYPFAKGVVIPPKGSLLFAVTADSIDSMTTTTEGTIPFNVSVGGVSWRYQGDTSEPTVDENIQAKGLFEYFKPIQLSAAVAATSPTGIVSKSKDLVVARFVVSAAKTPFYEGAHIGGANIQIDSSIAQLGNLKVYRGTELTPFYLLSEGAYKSSSSGMTVNFGDAMSLAPGSQQLITVVLDTLGAKSGDYVRVKLDKLLIPVESNIIERQIGIAAAQLQF